MSNVNTDIIRECASEFRINNTNLNSCMTSISDYCANLINIRNILNSYNGQISGYTIDYNELDSINDITEKTYPIRWSINGTEPIIQNVQNINNIKKIFDEKLEKILMITKILDVISNDIDCSIKKILSVLTESEKSILISQNFFNEVPTNSEEYTKLPDGEYITSKGYVLVISGGIPTIDNIIIANKTFALPSTYDPGKLTEETENAYKLMQENAEKEEITLKNVSGYRSYETQKNIYNGYLNEDPKEKVDTYSARPGHSEHQTGYTLDSNLTDDDFADTKEAIWLNDHAHEYGFIIRYPKGKEEITGYKYEPWHLRYVGKDLAKDLYNNGDWITLEEYYGITSQY